MSALAIQKIDAAILTLQDARRALVSPDGSDVPEIPAERPSAPPVSEDRGLSRPAAFFEALRASKVLGATLEQNEVEGCNAIMEACEGWPVSWAAYALATAMVETAGTMQPVKEAYWLSDSAAKAWATKMYGIEGARPEKARELGNLEPGDGARYMGRGYVQLTGKANYARAEAELGLPLISQPDKALEPDAAAAIMRRGMEEGWFTRKALRIYPQAIETREQFVHARKVINGTDRAGEIADLALKFQSALQAGGWR